jgi:Histone acetyltransferase
MDDGVLSLSGRGHTAADVERASVLVRAAGFRLILQMMTGLPGDTEEKDLETARRLIALKPDGVRIYPTVIVRDTALYDMWRAGEYREHTVEDAVRVCAKLLPLFEEAGIPVIRLGLNPTEELSNGAAIAGAYHPALGELVKSRILLKKARTLLAGTEPGSRVTLTVGRGRTSQMAGQHRENIRKLSEEFSLSALRIREESKNEGEILCFSIEK